MSLQIDSPQVLEALSRGMILEANELMGGAYSISAFVIHGNHLGRQLGFPTANLKLPENKPSPLAHGVYAVKIEFNQSWYKGMANVGVRPTVDGKNLAIEIHLFDFSGDLYGKTLRVHFFGRIRNEQKFKSLDALVNQLHMDKQQALNLLF